MRIKCKKKCFATSKFEICRKIENKNMQKYWEIIRSYPRPLTGIRTKQRVSFSPLTSAPAGIRTKPRVPFSPCTNARFGIREKPRVLFRLTPTPYLSRTKTSFPTNWERPRIVTCPVTYPLLWRAWYPPFVCLVLFSTPNRQVVLFFRRNDLTLYAYVYMVPPSLNRILYVINSRSNFFSLLPANAYWNAIP